MTFAPGYWLPEEMCYLDLLNCTRTGGWVQTDGTCKGCGSGRYSTYVAPFWYAAAVQRDRSPGPTRGCWRRGTSAATSTAAPIQRMRAAGYPTITNWGENIGCRTTTNTRAAVLASHLFFQSEKSTNGGHWRNIKNSAFTLGRGRRLEVTAAGSGWSVDFYH